MAKRYAPDVEPAIARALAEGKPTMRILDALHAGTLDGLRGPVDMPRRTFFDKVAKLRERMVAPAATGEDGAAFLERLQRECDEVRELAAQGLAAAEIIEATDLSAVNVTAYLTDPGKAISEDFQALRLRETTAIQGTARRPLLSQQL